MKPSTDALKQAQVHADMAALQRGIDALSAAQWHVAQGEFPKALSRIRRAQSHIKMLMERQK